MHAKIIWHRSIKYFCVIWCAHLPSGGRQPERPHGFELFCRVCTSFVHTNFFGALKIGAHPTAHMVGSKHKTHTTVCLSKQI